MTCSHVDLVVKGETGTLFLLLAEGGMVGGLLGPS